MTKKKFRYSQKLKGKIACSVFDAVEVHAPDNKIQIRETLDALVEVTAVIAARGLGPGAPRHAFAEIAECYSKNFEDALKDAGKMFEAFDAEVASRPLIN